MRWVYVLSGLIINICLGSIYSYSVLQIHLKKLFENEYGIKVSATEMQIPYLIFLALFSFCMPFAGKLIEKFGPQKIGIIGGILLSIAWFSASFAKSPLELSIIYGIIGGIAVGTVYNCPLVTVAKWFPDGRGLALGITLIGFGISPALISPIIDILTNNYGIKQTLKIMGLAFFIIIPLLASNLRTPSKIIKSENENGTEKNIKIKDMIRIPSFYGLWISFAIANFVGLMAIGISKPIGIEIATKSGISEKEITHILTFLMIPFAISNGLGRPLFGWLTDKLKPQKAATISLLSILFAVIYIYFNSNSLFTYVIVFCILWMNLGGWMAIAPTTTAVFFGLKNYSSNYGLVFTAYGIGAILGNLTVGIIKDITGSYLNIFPIVMILIFFGVIISYKLLNFPKF